MRAGVRDRLVETEAAPAHTGALLSRQPILDRDRRAVGYSLHLLPAPSTSTGAEPAPATLRAADLDLLTAGAPAFVTLPLPRVADAAIPPSRFVVEVPCATGVGLADTCEQIRGAGFGVALDGFELSDVTRPLLGLATYARMAFLPATSRDRRDALAAAAAAGVRLVASGVDAPEVFDEARREGFTHFQGTFLERRAVGASAPLRSDRLVYLEILRALADPELPAPALEDLVKRDAALSFRILRMVNSAGFAQQSEVTSMRHALLLVGRNTICRWASLAVLAGLGATAPNELVVMATTRARFCERLGARHDDDLAGKGFLAGLCSLLDTLLQQPLRAVVDDLPIADDVKAALFGVDNRVRHVLECVMAYERGDWATCLELASLLDLDVRTLAPAYLDALRAARDLTHPA